MTIRVTSLSANLAAGITTVTFDLLEQIGRFQKVKASLTVDLEGRYTDVDDALTSAIEAALSEHGESL